MDDEKKLSCEEQKEKDMKIEIEINNNLQKIL